MFDAKTPKGHNLEGTKGRTEKREPYKRIKISLLAHTTNFRRFGIQPFVPKPGFRGVPGGLRGVSRGTMGSQGFLRGFQIVSGVLQGISGNA